MPGLLTSGNSDGRLIGRRTETTTLRATIQAHRLVTLVGPPGVGKTTLARAVLPDPGMPVHWLSVTAPDTRDVLSTRLGAQLDIEPGPEVRERVTTRLSLDPALVVVDACEWSLAEAGAFIAALLEHAPPLSILATSRQPLGVPGEVLFEVHPLEEADAIALFRDRLARACASAPDPDEAEVAELCGRLDRLPLSLEIAAAEVAHLPWDELVEEVRNRPLSDPLRAALAASHDRLKDEDRQVFRRLAVFPATFSTDAAVAVSGHEADAESTRRCLKTLAASSLVVVERKPPGGYRLLDTVRDYALERLREAGEDAHARDAHARHFLEQARRSKVDLLGSAQATAAKELARRGEDLRAALAWARDCDRGLFVDLATALRPWWLLQADVAEGRQILLEAAELAGPESTAAAAALLGALRISLECGWLEDARAEGERAVRIYGRVGDPLRKRRAAVGAAWAAALLGDLESAQVTLKDALASARAGHDSRGIYDAAWCLGQVVWRLGDSPGAEVVLDEARQAAIEVGASQLVAHAEDACGHLADTLNHDEAAGRHFRRSLMASRAVSSAGLQVHAQVNLSRLALRAGDPGRARPQLLEALSLASRHGVSTHRLASLVEGFGWLAQSEQRYRRAIRLFHAGDAIRHAGRSRSLELWEVAATERSWLDVAVREVGHGVAERCAAEGRAMTAAEALVEAARTGRARSVSDVLSNRETQVAMLVADGMTNGAIARELGISVRTVDSHLENLRSKLGLASRAEVAAWAAVRRD